MSKPGFQTWNMIYLQHSSTFKDQTKGAAVTSCKVWLLFPAHHHSSHEPTSRVESSPTCQLWTPWSLAPLLLGVFQPSMSLLKTPCLPEVTTIFLIVYSVLLRELWWNVVFAWLERHVDIFPEVMRRPNPQCFLFLGCPNLDNKTSAVYGSQVLRRHKGKGRQGCDFCWWRRFPAQVSPITCSCRQMCSCDPRDF